MTIMGYFDYCKRHDLDIVIDMKSFKNCALSKKDVGIINAWDYFFDPLSNTTLEEVKGLPFLTKPNTTVFGINYIKWVPKWFKKIIKCRAKIDFPTTIDYIYNEEKYLKYCAYYKKYFKLSKNAFNYVTSEESQLLPKVGKILGIICRSTDYTQSKPYGHHIQPTNDEIVTQINEFLSKHNDYKSIYVASDTDSIVNIIKDLFVNYKIITNKRVCYDGIDFSKTNLASITIDGVDEYFRNMSYFSSINLISKCNALIAGLCCGTQMALIMNNNKYEYVHLFDLGYYGVDDKI